MSSRKKGAAAHIDMLESELSTAESILFDPVIVFALKQLALTDKHRFSSACASLLKRRKAQMNAATTRLTYATYKQENNVRDTD